MSNIKQLELDIIKDYEENILKVVEIRNKYGITPRNLKRIRDKYNIPQRAPRLTVEEKEYIELNFETGKTTVEIAATLKRNRGVVYSYLIRQGYDLSRESILKKHIDEVEEMYKEGLSIKEIADKLNLTKNYVGTAIYNYIKADRRNKLTENTKKNIIKDIEKSELNQKEIAKKYNVSEAIISIIKMSQEN